MRKLNVHRTELLLIAFAGREKKLLKFCYDKHDEAEDETEFFP